MELDFSTFLLEIVNFLILVWILKRFLYRPVLDFIGRRRAETEEAMAAAQHAREESEKLKAQYENRLTDWAHERDGALSRLRQEMDQERARRLEEIRRALDGEREKAQVAEERRRREFRVGAEEQALELAGQFASRVLTTTAGPEATRALAGFTVTELGSLDEERREALRRASADGARGRIEVAHPLDAAQRGSVEHALQQLFGREHAWEWQVVPELLAGIRVVLGAWELAANLRDELKGFTALAHGPAAL